MTSFKKAVMLGMAMAFGASAAMGDDNSAQQQQPPVMTENVQHPATTETTQDNDAQVRACTVNNYEYLVDQFITAVDVDALRDERAVRIIELGTPVSQDYRKERLNLTVRIDGKILAVGCF